MVLSAVLAGCSSLPQARRQSAETAVARWSEESRLAATALMLKYGAPDRVQARQLAWNGKGPWLRLRVWDAGARPDADDMEMTLLYPVPADKQAALAEFSDKIRVSEDGQQLSMRCASENLGFLLANLASEIIRGLKDPAAARASYDRILQRSAAGKSSSYLTGLRFPRWPAPLSDSPGGPP